MEEKAYYSYIFEYSQPGAQKVSRSVNTLSSNSNLDLLKKELKSQLEIESNIILDCISDLTFVSKIKYTWNEASQKWEENS